MKNINYYFIYIFFQIKRGNNNPIIKGTKMGEFYVKFYYLFATRDINFYVRRCINEEWIFLREIYIYIYLLIYFYSTRSRIKKIIKDKRMFIGWFRTVQASQGSRNGLTHVNRGRVVTESEPITRELDYWTFRPIRLIVVNCAFYDRALWTVCVPLIKSSFYAE